MPAAFIAPEIIRVRTWVLPKVVTLYDSRSGRMKLQSNGITSAIQPRTNVLQSDIVQVGKKSMQK